MKCLTAPALAGAQIEYHEGIGMGLAAAPF